MWYPSARAGFLSAPQLAVHRNVDACPISELCNKTHVLFRISASFYNAHKEALCATAPVESAAMDVLSYLHTLEAGVTDILLPWAGRIPAALIARTTLHKLSAKEQLLAAFESADRVFVLTRGTMLSTSPAPDGTSFVIDEFSAPAAFGEMEAIGASPLYHSALVAASSCELLSISQEDYLSWLAHDPDALLARSRWCIQRLSAQSTYERSLLGWTGLHRVAFALAQAHEAAHDEQGVCVVGLTRAQLAERLGVSTKTITRALASLEERHMVDARGRKIVVNRKQRALIDRMLRDELGHEL